MHSILAVDDSASMRQMVSFTLKNAGFNVVEAVDGQDAWEKANGRELRPGAHRPEHAPHGRHQPDQEAARAPLKFKATPILILTTESPATR
jgi:two-component system chemotaxis response regulator CheY